MREQADDATLIGFATAKQLTERERFTVGRLEVLALEKRR